MPSLPYTARPGDSILKVISLQKPNDDCDADSTRSCLLTAAVLTVLGEVPPDNGATVLRPPYFGTDKPLFSTVDMDANLGILPRLSAAPEFDSRLPTLETALETVKRVNIVHVHLARPGECILDPDLTPGSTFTEFSCQAGQVCGRFPDQHGTRRDFPMWQSLLAEAMWPVFRNRW